MKLGQAHKKFATVSLDGWDGTNWVLGIAKGSMEVYSRFITERTFGVVKRLFMMPQSINPLYTVVRFPDGIQYLIAKESKDYRNNAVYGYTYLLQEVIAQAQIVTITKTDSASGMGSSTGAETLSAEIPCYFERYSSIDSREVDDVTYSRTRILFPSGTILDISNQIKIGDRRFTIRLVDLELNLSRAYTIEE